MVPLLLQRLQDLEDDLQLGGVVGLPASLRLKAQTTAIGTASAVGVAVGGGGGPGGADQLGHREPARGNVSFDRHQVVGIHEWMTPLRNGVLPDELFAWDLWAEIEAARSEVAVGQLEPGPREGVGEGLLVLMKAPGNRRHDGVVSQREIRRRHDGCGALPVHMGIGNEVLGSHVLGDPLPCPGRAFGEFPFVGEHHLEIAPVPAGGVGLPGPFDAARDRVLRAATAKAVLPTQALLLEAGSFGFGIEVLGRCGAVAFAEGVATGNQGHGFFHRHAHAGKGVAHIFAGGHRIGMAFRPLRIHINQPHLDSGEGLIEAPVRLVALIA